MSRGRRFDDEPRLNVGKVIATIIAFVVLVMVIASVIMLIKQSKQEKVVNNNVKYFSLYTNSKWGVINSRGEEIIPASYDEMIVIPDKSRGLFIVVSSVNYETEEFTTKVLNEKGEEILRNYTIVEALDNYSSSDEVWYEENVLKFKKDGKYGLIDFDGNVLLPAEYENIETLKGIERSILITKGGKVGLYNNVSKETIIEPKYIKISALGDSYENGYIVTDENNKSGIIGSNKNVILANSYDEVKNAFGNDIYVVKNDNKLSVIKSDGTVILDSGFDDVKSIDGDNIIVKVGNNYGVINKNKENVIEAKYEDLDYAYGDNYIEKSSGKYGVINTLGEQKIENKYEMIQYFDDSCIFQADNVDYTSDIYSREFENKLSGTVLKVDSKKNYIKIRIGDENKYYNLKFEEKTNKDIFTNNTLFLVKKEGKYGYVNKENKQVVDCIYDDAMEQNEFGFCAVKKEGKWGALKADGTVILEPSLELNENLFIDFIGKWHLSKYLELETYTDK